jgi:hypothetical protein
VRTRVGERKLEMVESTVGLPPPSSPRAAPAGAPMRFSSMYGALGTSWARSCASVIVKGSLLLIVCSRGALLKRPFERMNRNSKVPASLGTGSSHCQDIALEIIPYYAGPTQRNMCRKSEFERVGAYGSSFLFILAAYSVLQHFFIRT